MDEMRAIIRKIIEAEQKNTAEYRKQRMKPINEILEELENKELEIKELKKKESEMKEKQLKEKDWRVKEQMRIIINQDIDDKTKLNIITSLFLIEFPEAKELFTE